MIRSLFILFLIVAGCASPRSVKPSLYYQGKQCNHWIANRKPPIYGDGTAEGCVVQGEFSIAMNTAHNEILTVIFDARTKRPVSFAKVEIYYMKEPPVIAKADTEGKILLPIGSTIETITVEYPGYRPLTITPQL